MLLLPTTSRSLESIACQIFFDQDKTSVPANANFLDDRRNVSSSIHETNPIREVKT
jgi:hypothetical protein